MSHAILKVSVIIPTFNRAQYVCEAIDSVLSQTFKDYEIVLTKEGKFARNYNTAILKSKGKYVKEVMQESPPIVSKQTSIQVVSNLLKHFPMMLVSDEGKLVGVITKSDLIGKLYKA